MQRLQTHDFLCTFILNINSSQPLILAVIVIKNNNNSLKAENGTF